ncbi:acyltransferase [Ensifer sp. LCM 4579]|uniref:acyltransferase n=1 Tax=Ensifer sp. LCM 4579 TaxID=1848292 RepID=UPI001041FE08|nr:acyltransferase [Ensifer sp. LCM 4579]
MAQIKVVDKGVNNSVSLPQHWKILRNSQVLIAGDNNTIAIGEKCRFDGLNIVLKGNNNTLQIGDNVLGTGVFTLSGSGKLLIGDNSTIGRCVMTAYHGTISIGKDCMFAQGLEIRTTDSHPVFDLRTRRRINSDRDVVIEDYVWCGARVTVLKGARIAKSSIVALGSIVTKQFEPFTLLGGYPAKVLRTGVTWTRRTRNEILEEDEVAMMYTADWSQGAEYGPDPQPHRVETNARKIPGWVNRFVSGTFSRRKI